MLYSAFTYTKPFDARQNIGDFIQTIAAVQFLPRVDYFVEREAMELSAKKPESFLIANGWYMHFPDKFPPPLNIKPFYTSIHIEYPDMLTQKAIEHFKEHGPIGCRDFYTLELLKSKGIPVYLSECLTLTLSNKFNMRNENIYFVDVDKSFLNIIPDQIKKKAIYSTQELSLGFPLRIAKKLSLELYTQIMLKRGQEFIDHYSKAKLVITSRLHCYFPCLALKTPVILLIPDRVTSPSRFIKMESWPNIYTIKNTNNINWHPFVPDIKEKADFLSDLVKKAVQVKDNPLKHYPISYFSSHLR